MKTLIVVDMQNDFVTGSLGSSQAQAIVPNVKSKIEEYRKNGDKVIFTRDTHSEDYLETMEGKCLPVPHCILGTQGYNIVDGLYDEEDSFVNKNTFGVMYWGFLLEDYNLGPLPDSIELIGLCTDICVVSNALILKSELPEIPITVDASCCAGVTEESHKAALLTMKMCQINVINEG